VKKVAVFGNAGGGKSTLAKRLAELTHIPLYPLDMIEFRAGGGKVPHDDYLKAHAELLQRDAWIIDGFGGAKSAWERFARADTLVYVDLAAVHTLSVGHQAPVEGPLCHSRRVARRQPDAEQHDRQLPGALAMSPSLDPQIQGACF
jgi:hypothetical protein